MTTLKASQPAGSRKSTPALMFQGTASNAGKSILTAALCRILLQDGLRPAPFKAQNMSLNSCVTKDGGEIGRAQAVQAQACRLDPDVRMNPVLLKPHSDIGAQVIVRGKVVRHMTVGQYIAFKSQAFEAVRQCYDSLADEFDAVILEGAGSPAEINLKHHDIVNMAMARHAMSPVLIAGDIDRGGVYAAFVGTMEILDPWERDLTAGFVINRFRGDPGLLEPANDYILRKTGRPVLGVVPYLQNLGLPEEDSVSFKQRGNRVSKNDSTVEIAVIDLPHISNFTDFDALEIEDDVRVSIIRKAGDLKNPAAVILPGSKNVAGDLAYLESSGIADGVRNLANQGRTRIIGICGGFQMIGERIFDPCGVEFAVPTRALGLIALQTTMEPEKILARTCGVHVRSGQPVYGYEIHHGRTRARNLCPIMKKDNGTPLAFGAEDERIWGTYLHGVFDADSFRRHFIDALRRDRGLAPVGEIRARYDIEAALDRLADTVRSHLDMNTIYRIMGI